MLNKEIVQNLGFIDYNMYFCVKYLIMIEKFEDKTPPLNETEKKLTVVIVRGLIKRTKENPVTSTQIRKGISDRYGYDLSPVRIRKIINHIRTRNLAWCVIGSSKGYYVTQDEKDINLYITSLQQRCDAIQNVINNISKYL